MHLLTLWNNIVSLLDSEFPAWRERIDDMGQVSTVQARKAWEDDGAFKEDDEVFKAVLLAVLSAGVDWSIVENGALPDLDDFLKDELKPGLFLESYSNLLDERINVYWKEWFRERSATPRFFHLLIRMKETARRLDKHSKTHGKAEDYFTRLMAQHDSDPKKVALCIGCDRQYKLPALGVPLAAEALKNLGFDVAKPDRHLCRAMRAFGLVIYEQVKKGEPQYRNKNKQLEVMTKVEEIANAAGKPVAYVDNAIWMLVAEGERQLADRALAELGGSSQIQTKDQSGLVALLDSWEKEGDVEEHKETLEYLIRALDENRPEGYKHFPPELKGKSW